MLLSTSFVVLAILFSSVKAQTPTFRGELLITPGSFNKKCLTAASNNDGASVTVSDCNGQPSQKWTFSGGSVRVFDNKCLDVPGGHNTNGVKLHIWTCSNNGNPNQQWWYTNRGDNHLAWKDHGKCLDLTGGSAQNDNRIQLWTCSNNPNQIWNVGYRSDGLPNQSQNGQVGTNQCGTGSDQSSMCQTAWINSAEDFCLWAPSSIGTIGNTEQQEVAWCTKNGHGSRLMPSGTLHGVHFIKSPDYVQVTGVGDFTKINVANMDEGGELDPHGADGRGNPIGGLVYGSSFFKNMQYHEWTSFISYSEFCFRACTGPNAARNCQHIYDVMGCNWNIPGNYDANVFENCQGDDTEPMGIYHGTSTWYQGQNPTPAAHPPARSSSCVAVQSPTANKK